MTLTFLDALRGSGSTSTLSPPVSAGAPLAEPLIGAVGPGQGTNAHVDPVDYSHLVLSWPLGRPTRPPQAEGAQSGHRRWGAP